MILGSVFLFSWSINRSQKSQKLVVSIADRITIFAYLYLPVGLVGLAVALSLCGNKIDLCITEDLSRYFRQKVLDEAVVQYAA